MGRLVNSFAVGLSAAILLVACGGGSENTGGEDMVMAMIPAETGGTVEIGEASLDIPGGSLSGDTEVTVETSAPGSDLPDQDTLTGMVYDFGPDGTTFDPPATLALPLDGTPAEGQEAVISYLDEAANAWVDLESTVSGGMVTAEVEHFTKFIIRFTDAAGGGEAVCEFELCGGDIVGVWELAGACGDVVGDAFDEACPTATVEADLTGSEGIVTLNEDGTYEVDVNIGGMLSINFPMECVESAQVTTCDQLAALLAEEATCTDDGAGGCDCTGPIPAEDDPPETGTYTVDETNFTLTTMEDGSTEPDSEAGYCVEDTDTLYVLIENGIVLTFHRQ